MPELAEVEVVRLGLEPLIVGQTISSVSATGLRSVRRATSPQDFERRLTGATVVSLDRWGKYLILNLQDACGADACLVHLRMSGQLLWRSRDAEQIKHTHVRVSFEANDNELQFVDPRTFGEMFLATSQDLVDLAKRLGPDPFTLVGGVFDIERFVERVRATRAQIKPLLLSQKLVAGIGNIYADEILWRAKVRPWREANTLSKPKAGEIAGLILSVLSEAVAAGGSTLGDGQYVGVDGAAGSYQDHHEVHAREGQACRRCGREIEKFVVGGRGTYVCRSCQK